MFFCLVQNFFFRTTRVRIFFFCRAKRDFFPLQNSTLGYMTKIVNQIIFFFLHQNQNIFLATLGIRTDIFFRKKTYPPPPPPPPLPFQLNSRSLKEDLIAILNTTHKNIDRNVEFMWQAFKTAIQNTIDKRVPSKFTQGRHTHPWINTTIRRRKGQKKSPQKGQKD